MGVVMATMSAETHKETALLQASHPAYKLMLLYFGASLSFSYNTPTFYLASYIMSSKQALVFGASGISGWSIARTCLKYPTPDTFSRVIACTLKPIEKKAFHLSNEDASRLEIHSGINLTTDVDKVTEKLKEIPDIEATTHVYYTGK